MFRRFSNSWQLVKASYSVLRADKELIVFPIASFLGVVAISIVFLVPALLAGVADSIATDGNVPVFGYVIAFLYYLVMYTIVFFSNTALVGAVMIRLDGGDPTLQDGINIAMSKLDKIIGYALIASTVGLVLNWLRDQGAIGRIVAGLFGLAWNIATFLVVPVLVTEDVGPIDAVKRSTGLLKQTWGEQIIGNFSMGIIFFLLYVAVVIATIPLIVLMAGTGSAILVGLSIGVLVLALAAVALVQSTLQGIYVAAVYRYATVGEVEYFSQEQIAGAFKQK